jgi:Zn finger protein HypA/HybF involved in hydrogenase expression
VLTSWAPPGGRACFFAAPGPLMPLARARCAACTLPLGDPPHVPLAIRCGRCGAMAQLAVAADGTPTDFDAAFTPPRLLAWLGHARLAMAHGVPGVALGACKACTSPLTMSSKERVALPCPHCKEPVHGAAADVLLDQWPEPWTKVEGAGLDLEYRLALLDAASGISAGCAACGQPTPPADPSNRCARCGAVTWVERGEQRVQLAVRVNGTRQTRPFNGVLPIVQGEQMLRTDAALGSSDQSGKSCLRVWGLGCATAQPDQR